MLIIVILAASSEPSDSAPIPPTQENMEEQQQEAAQGEEEETEEDGKDSALADEPELAAIDTNSDDVFTFLTLEEISRPRLSDDFYYEAEKIHAKPLTTDEKEFPENTLSL